MHRALLLAVFTVSLLLFSGCPGGDGAPVPAKEAPIISVDGWVADVEATETIEEEGWPAKALEERDASYCLKLPFNERDDCVLPISNDSLPNCLQLIKYENKRVCLFHHAYETEDMSICDLMSDADRLECVEHLSPPCTFIMDKAERGRCFAFELQNYTYCTDDGCYMDYAFEFKDKDACSMVSSSPKAAGCRSAVTYKDECKELDLSNKYLCYYTYALGTNNPTYCYYINGVYDSALAYQCFTHFAIVREDPSMCSAVAVLNRWDCYIDYALATGNKEGCYAIDTRAPFNREKCFKEYAYAYDDLAACNEIETEYERQICYSALIFSATELTPTECNSVWLPEWKDKCYQELARLENSQTYCNYIEGAAVKNNCNLMFQ